MNEKYEVIIIGAGIAGITAAIYAARKRMKFLLISKDIGGQINLSGEIENYPGFKHMTGIEFTKSLMEQIEYNDIKIESGIVENIEKEGKEFIIKTGKADYKTATIIIASGARARKLNIPGEDKFANKGVAYCAICDGPLFKDKVVAVIGGGDSALEAVDFLMNIAKKIYLLNIEDDIKGQEYLKERVLDKDKVEVINNARTTEIFGEKFVSGLRYEKEGEIKEFECEGIFVEIGRVPNAGFVNGLVELDEQNHIKIGKYCETSVNGIYAAGDVTDIYEYQYVIAAGQGCIALLSASKKI